MHGAVTRIDNVMTGGTQAFKHELHVVVTRDPRNRPTSAFARLFWTERLDLGIVARRMITTAGVRNLCDDFNAATGGADISLFKWHEMGLDFTAENVADTALGSPVEARVAGSQASATSAPNATYTTVATIVATAVRLIREHGIFNQVTGGTLWDRSVFGLITLGIGDSITFTYVLTANAGG